MKKFLTILLFFATILMFGQQINNYSYKKDLIGLLNYSKQHTNLTEGIQVITPTQNYNDFSKMNSSSFPYLNSEKIMEHEWFYGGYSPEGFYKLDFAEDPFDGRIQVLVMGEPLPSQTVSLILGILAVGSIVYLKKNQKVIS